MAQEWVSRALRYDHSRGVRRGCWCTGGSRCWFWPCRLATCSTGDWDETGMGVQGTGRDQSRGVRRGSRCLVPALQHDESRAEACGVAADAWSLPCSTGKWNESGVGSCMPWMAAGADGCSAGVPVAHGTGSEVGPHSTTSQSSACVAPGAAAGWAGCLSAARPSVLSHESLADNTQLKRYLQTRIMPWRQTSWTLTPVTRNSLGGPFRPCMHKSAGRDSEYYSVDLHFWVSPAAGEPPAAAASVA